MVTALGSPPALPLLTFAAFQAGLAAGAPWGRAAYGGAHAGSLPPRLRVVSGVAAVGYGAAAGALVLGAGSPEGRRRGLLGLAVLMSAGTVLNAASSSVLERSLWTPVTAATAALAWREARAQRA